MTYEQRVALIIGDLILKNTQSQMRAEAAEAALSTRTDGSAEATPDAKDGMTSGADLVAPAADKARTKKPAARSKA